MKVTAVTQRQLKPPKPAIFTSGSRLASTERSSLLTKLLFLTQTTNTSTSWEVTATSIQTCSTTARP